MHKTTPPYGTRCSGTPATTGTDVMGDQSIHLKNKITDHAHVRPITRAALAFVKHEMALLYMIVRIVTLVGLTGMHKTGCSGDKTCPART